MQAADETDRCSDTTVSGNSSHHRPQPSHQRQPHTYSLWGTDGRLSKAGRPDGAASLAGVEVGAAQIVLDRALGHPERAADPHGGPGAPVVESVWVEPYPDELIGIAGELGHVVVKVDGKEVTRDQTLSFIVANIAPSTTGACGPSTPTSGASCGTRPRPA